MNLLLIPLFWLSYITKPLLLLLYKIYLLVNKRFFASIKFTHYLYHLIINRQVIYVLALVLALFVSSTNLLQASELNFGNLQSFSPASRVLSGEDEEDIIETAESIKPKKHYLNQDIALLSPVQNITPLSEEEEEMLTLSGSTFIKENILATNLNQRTDIFTHQVNRGETLSSLAERFGVSSQSIMASNRLTSSYLKPGVVLSIPAVEGIIYNTKNGDTLNNVARTYKITADEIADYNGLENNMQLVANQTLILPRAVAPSVQIANTSNYPTAVTILGNNPPAAAVISGTKLQWPTTSHRISQYSHYGHVALDVDGNTGDPIYAAEAGTVISAGWAGAYGIRIIIDHGNGLQTLYAHLSKIYLSAGQKVTRGQTIGLQGSTGRSTGDHLHFEVMQNNVKYNPFSFF